MRIEVLPHELSVCKLPSLSDLDLQGDFYFVGRTDEEVSLVCRADAVPERVISRDDGWRAFRIQGELDFSLVGVLAGITGVLAESGIGIFAVSTFNTDYILVRSEKLEAALAALGGAGYEIA